MDEDEVFNLILKSKPAHRTVAALGHQPKWPMDNGKDAVAYLLEGEREQAKVEARLTVLGYRPLPESPA